MLNQDGVYNRTSPWASEPERQVSDVLAYLASQAPACWTPPRPAPKTRTQQPTIYDVLGMSKGDQRGP
ncbi:hypothetical protein ACFZCP_14910 [Streptomyces sp. NPDC007971]|uniref:hypothetical protein n=1 Tax=Streptomyces sp. NPDC007971 TaxID=3364799 RepID=UPI0036E07CB7